MKSVKIFSRSPFSILWWSGTLSSFGDWATLFASVALASYLGANDGNSELIPIVIFSQSEGKDKKGFTVPDEDLIKKM